MSSLKIVSFLLVIACYSCDSGADTFLTIEHRITFESREYLQITWPQKYKAQVLTSREEEAFEGAVFCIPLTAPGEDTALRYFHCLDGHCSDTALFQLHLPAMLAVSENGLEFTQAATLEEALERASANSGKDHVQLLPLLLKGELQGEFDRIRKFQCRALVQFEDGRTGMLETLKHQSLDGFAKDLKSFGVHDALLTITHTLDEGWYRYAGAQFPLGRLRSETRKQSNWLLISPP